jgi:hypothetical protein
MGISNFKEVDRSVGQLSQEGNFPLFDPLSEKANPKLQEIIRGVCSIFTSLMMLPVDRVVAKKTVGLEITRETLREIAKKPFLGLTPRLNECFSRIFADLWRSCSIPGTIRAKVSNGSTFNFGNGSCRRNDAGQSFDSAIWNFELENANAGQNFFYSSAGSNQLWKTPPISLYRNSCHAHERSFIPARLHPTGRETQGSSSEKKSVAFNGVF